MPLVRWGTQSKLWEEVARGQELTPLHFPITVKTLVLAVCGTRDLMPYHHNPEYSKSIGNRGMFVNTMFEQALFARFVTDWCGPESDFRETSLEMVGQIVPGDTAVIRGKVSSKYRLGNDYRIELELTASTDHGLAARSTAVLAMPSEEAGEVEPFHELGKPNVTSNRNMPLEAREHLGKVSAPRDATYPISEIQISYWCDMVEDENPLYFAGEYSRECRHESVIAPPMGLISWMMGRAGRMGVSASAPDVDCPERAPWPPLPAGAASGGGMFMPPGATDTIATRSAQYYGKPLRPGDRVHTTSELLDCSGLKQTKLGPGYFTTDLTTFYNQHDQIVGTNLFTLLRYGVPSEQPESDSVPQSEPQSQSQSQPEAADDS